jgi:hypothetical protein
MIAGVDMNLINTFTHSSSLRYNAVSDLSSRKYDKRSAIQPSCTYGSSLAGGMSNALIENIVWETAGAKAFSIAGRAVPLVARIQF